LQAAAEDHPVVILTGARQVGKSTLLRHADPFRNWRYHTMDDFDALRQAQEHPEGLWAGTDDVVIDEVQRAPELLPAIKRAVDQHPRKYRFVLSGSANLLLMKAAGESLAGRAVYLVLDPLTLGEINASPPPTILAELLSGNLPAESTQPVPPDPTRWILRGFMPALLRLSGSDAWLRWWEGYLTTYLERDLRQLSQIESLVDFRRVMQLLTLRSAQLLNQSELARDAQVSQPTIHRYINLLESTYLFERLPPYATSHSTRLVKAPRAIWADTGLAVYLAGYFDELSLRQSRELGCFFETMIYQHLRVQTAMLTPRARLYFWRTRTGNEVDFVVEHGRRVIAIEAKMTDNPGYRHTEGLRKFMAEHPTTAAGVLLHSGSRVVRLEEKIVALPWTLLTG
jgi:predicted AAA+ superfamily ATPase